MYEKLFNNLEKEKTQKGGWNDKNASHKTIERHEANKVLWNLSTQQAD